MLRCYAFIRTIINTPHCTNAACCTSSHVQMSRSVSTAERSVALWHSDTPWMPLRYLNRFLKHSPRSCLIIRRQCCEHHKWNLSTCPQSNGDGGTELRNEYLTKPAQKKPTLLTGCHNIDNFQLHHHHFFSFLFFFLQNRGKGHNKNQKTYRRIWQIALLLLFQIRYRDNIVNYFGHWHCPSCLVFKELRSKVIFYVSVDVTLSVPWISFFSFASLIYRPFSKSTVFWLFCRCVSLNILSRFVLRGTSPLMHTFPSCWHSYSNELK